MQLVKLSNGFDVYAPDKSYMGNVVVGQTWMDKGGQYLITIISFNYGRETFECEVFDAIHYFKSQGSIQDTLHFFSNYTLSKPAQPAVRANVGNLGMPLPNPVGFGMGGAPQPNSNYSVKFSIAPDDGKHDDQVGLVPINFLGLKTSRCECGGHKAGFKDHTRQHSSWCPVYKE